MVRVRTARLVGGALSGDSFAVGGKGMARYEGMDELLGRVRGRMAEEQAVDVETPSSDLGMPSVQYESALNRILTLLHEAEELHDVFKDPGYQEMPMGQIEDLLSILDTVQRELRRCEAVIQR